MSERNGILKSKIETLTIEDEGDDLFSRKIKLRTGLRAGDDDGCCQDTDGSDNPCGDADMGPDGCDNGCGWNCA